MKKFLVMYMVPVESMRAMMSSSAEERQASMATWGKWMGAHAADLADVGNPLGTNMRVTKDGATEVRNEMTGFSVVQAESQEAALEIVKDSPNLDMAGGYLEVMEMVQM